MNVTTRPELEKAEEYRQRANSSTVKTVEAANTAVALYKEIKAFEKEFLEAFGEEVKEKFEAHKEAVKERKTIEVPLHEAEEVLKAKIQLYVADSYEAIVEQWEIKCKAEIEWSQKMRDKEIALLEKTGRTAEAQGLRDSALPPPTIPRPKPMDGIEGLVDKTKWEFVVEDLALVPREYLTLDTKKVGAVVRSLKGETRIPGIKIWPEGVLEIR